MFIGLVTRRQDNQKRFDNLREFVFVKLAEKVKTNAFFFQLENRFYVKMRRALRISK